MALPVLHRKKSRAEGALERTGPSAGPAGWTPWTPWSELTELHERMGRLLGEAFGGGLVPAFAAEQSAWRPAADVEELDDAYVVELELPGVKREDVSVEFGGGEPSVTGEVKQKQRVGFLRTRARPVGQFEYRVSLPGEVQDDQVSASLADGVLAVRVPKTEPVRRHKITISTG